MSRCYKMCLMLALLTAAVEQANAAIVLHFFPVSDFSTNTAAMDAVLGVSGYTIDTFETTTLIPGLTIGMNGGVTPTTLTSLPNLFNENVCGSLSQNAAWDGTDTVTSITTNKASNCNNPVNVAQQITFNYAGGTSSFGIGMGNFQSVNAPQFPITNHELFVNGVDEGTIETLAGTNWTPGLARNAYLRIDGTAGTKITSLEFQSISATDVLMLDHLAVKPATSTPEPSAAWLLLPALAAIGLRRRAARWNR